MRVIGGEFRSRRLKSLPGRALRPTPDRLRETLFDVLAPRIAGAVFLDAYAGSGAVGIEALSRGAARAIFIENHRGAVEVIHQNLKSLGLEARAEVVRGKALVALPRREAGIVFLDPPYDLTGEYDAVLSALGERPPALVIAQHPARLALEDEYGQLHRVRLLKQGDNALSFFEPAR
ncbi:MAG: 16S rRNA (guanine(966)-N(2))-methyltransferase RsmD [Bryobacteraceae bacterium]|jgi:16S rRNA (guanine(966)-N(2))-methyltransferase RsmD